MAVNKASQMPARIIAAHGRHYVAESVTGILQVFPRGKRSAVAVGDQVLLSLEADGQASIDSILPRRNLLYRSDPFKEKLLASNLDQVVIVLATEPSFSEDFLGRTLVAAAAAELEVIILLNKVDMPERLEQARRCLAPYRDLGYSILEISVKAQALATETLLRPYFAAKSSILIGQSGMGKSSLLNLLVPDAVAHTREISAKLDSGKHTTTFTRSYPLPVTWGKSGVLIDAPGFQEFGLHHLSEGLLERAFPEFRPCLSGCKFYNCHHLQEPGCAVLAAVARGEISSKRQQLYAQLLHESRQRKPY